MADSGISRKTLEYAQGPPPRKPRAGAPVFEVIRRTLSILAVISAIVFSFTVSPLTLKVAVFCVLLSFMLDGVDSVILWTRKAKKYAQSKSLPKDQEPEPKKRRRFFTPWLFVSGGLGIVMMICLIANIGAFRPADSNMSPLVERGEIVVFTKRITDHDLVAGSLIVFRLSPQTKFGAPGSFVFGRIIAGPDDTISMRSDRYFVNGEPAGAVGPIDGQAAVDVPLAPESLRVPADRYFIVQETTVQGAADSRLLGWAERARVYGARMMRLSRRGWGVPLQSGEGQ